MWMMTVGVLCVEVHSQTKAPYLTFMKETIPNNSYVHLRQVGQKGSSALLVCHSNLSSKSCCKNMRGGWFFPNTTALPDGRIANTSPIAQRWLDQRIRIERGPSNSNISAIPSGIYQCDIAISHSKMETFYVGIYVSEGLLFTVYLNCSSNMVVGAHPHLLIFCLKLMNRRSYKSLAILLEQSS